MAFRRPWAWIVLLFSLVACVPGFRSRKDAAAYIRGWAWGVPAGRETVSDHLWFHALCAHSAGLLARPLAHGQGDGIELDHDLCVLELA